MKQADANLDSNKELSFCLQNFRCNNEYAIKPSVSNKFGGNIDTINNNENVCEPFEHKIDCVENESLSLDSTENTECSSNASKPQPKLSHANAIASQGLNSTEIDTTSVQDCSNDGFETVKKRRRSTPRKSKVIVGQNPVASLGTCELRANRYAVFVSRLAPKVSDQAVKLFVESMLGEDVDVERLQTKFMTYSSFKISCNIQMKRKLLDPVNWESGVIIRPFYN